MADKKINAGQVISLKSGIRTVIPKADDSEILYVVRELLDLDEDELIIVFHLSLYQWQKLRGTLYPNWTSNDWTVGSDIRVILAELHEQYMEDIIGQKPLF